MRNSLESFLVDNNESHIEAANHSIDQALIQIRSLPPVPFKTQTAALTAAADSYAARLTSNESAVATSLHQLESQIEVESRSVREELSKGESELRAMVENLTQQLGGIQQAATLASETIRQDAESRIAELRTEISNQKARLDTALSENQSAFSAAQEKRLNDFDATQQNITNNLNAFVLDQTSKQEELRGKARSLVDDLENKQQRANEILGFLAAANVAQAYLEEAKTQKEEADKWRWFALGIIGALGRRSPRNVRNPQAGCRLQHRRLH